MDEKVNHETEGSEGLAISPLTESLGDAEAAFPDMEPMSIADSGSDVEESHQFEEEQQPKEGQDERGSILAWSMYDWANSAFATTVMAGFFPLFFKEYWSSGGNEGTFWLGVANSVASIIVAALSPFLGAIADRGSAKKRFLTTLAYFGVLSTGGLFMVGEGMWEFALLLYIAGTIGFSAGNIFYDSLLPGVASPKKVDFTSSLGFALGYIGGGILFLVNVLMYLMPESFGITDGAWAIRISFLTVAIWWGIFTIPLILWVKEPIIHAPLSLLKATGEGWRQLTDTFREIRNMKVVGTFLLAYWLYIDGVDTIVRMAVSYGMDLGFEASSLIVALLIVQFVAFPAALVYNWMGGRIGVKKALFVGIMGYSVITLLGYFMTEEIHFYLLACMVGLFQGGIQALSRSYYTRLIPADKAAQFFGFYNMLGKFAAVIGPMLMGTITLLTGSPRLGILSILLLFALGAFFLSKVDEEEGIRAAREHLSG